MSWGTMDLETLAAVLLSMLLGGAIGVEREVANKPAGLRTNMLVAGAAAFLVGLGEGIIEHYADELNSPTFLRIDTLRIIEAVVTGVSFIGAGTILRRTTELEVEGLTTAATLLFTAALGIAVAVGESGVAIALTIVVLIILRVVARIESKFRATD